MSAYSETQRQAVHVAMAGFALTLRYLTWPQAALLAAAAVAFNAFVLARIAPGIIRTTDVGGARRAPRAAVARGTRRWGALFYPIAVFFLILVFRERLDIVAAAWGVMAFGDGFATLVGTTALGPRLPWNPEKSWNGLLAFVAAGSLGSVALCLWVTPSITPVPPPLYVVIAPTMATVVAAFVETMPIDLDDNLSVPAAAASVLWIGAQIDQAPVEWLDVLGGVLVSAPIAAAAGWSRAVTRGGALAGFACAVAIYIGTSLAGIAVLGVALALTIMSSWIGRRRKEALGIAEERGSRRGAGNILANCTVGAAGAVLAAFSSGWSAEAGALMMVTGIAAGASDTVASEIGKAFGGTPRAFPTFRVVPPGTPGAVSVAGTIAGIVGAGVIALPAVVLWLLPPDRIVVVIAACTAGALVESALSTRFEKDGVLDNHTLNLLNTASAAALAVWWASQ